MGDRMRIRLGLIGVEDNVEWIQSVVAEYAEFECIPFIHFYKKDVIELLQSHANEVDMWLFSGIYPYSIAKEWGQVQQPMFYISYTGTSLYKTLYHVLHHHKLEINKLSFDALQTTELKQLFEELNVPYSPSYLYEDTESISKIVKHHQQLWESDQTKGAVTCAWQVQKELESIGVPVFRVTHTKAAIKTVLDQALRTYEMLRMQDRQIAVQMVEVDTFSEWSNTAFSSDELYDVEMKNTHKWIKYAKKVQGSLKTVSPGCYVIFTTRGELSEVTDHFNVIPDLNEFQQIANAKVTCGIGIGQTAYDAEIRARNALLNARQIGKGNWMVHFEDKTIKGPLGKPENLTYSYGLQQMNLISEQTSLSVSTLSKIDSILRKLGDIEVTANDLGAQLQIMPRSARRILTQLEQSGYAEEIGEESPNPRGRPRKVYRILFREEAR